MSKLADSTAANSTEEARFEAQRLAFAPIAFQATRLLRDKGILEAARAAGPAGLSFEELCGQVAIPEYGVRVLVEAGLGIGLLNG